MVRERHQILGKKVGKGAANKTLRAFRAFYNSAQALDTTLPPNPTVALKRAWFKLAPRKSALRTRDMAKFGRELVALRTGGRFGELRADYFALMLLTGMRRTALAKVRREHVDPATRSIHVPAPKGGADRAFTLPLSDAAWAIVERRLAASNSPWLFPSPQDPMRPIRDVRADGAFSDWTDANGDPVAFTRHGLRATFIGAGHAAGVSDRYMMLLANHALHKGDVHGGKALRVARADPCQSRARGCPRAATSASASASGGSRAGRVRSYPGRRLSPGPTSPDPSTLGPGVPALFFCPGCTFCISR
jgi:integrase